MRGRETQQKARCQTTSHRKSDQSPQHQYLAVRQLWCFRSLVDVSRPVFSSVCLMMRTLPCRQGSSVSCSGRFSGKTMMNMSARACAELGASASSSSATGASRWLEVRSPMRAVMCVLFDAGWFPLHPTNWTHAGGEGVYWFFAFVADSAELIQVLSRVILSVRWAVR